VKLFREHIAFKILTVVIVATLVFPTAVKFAHIFSHHKHEVCKNHKTTHLHKVDLDCDFLKFLLNNHSTLTNQYNPLFQISSYFYKIPVLTYTYFNNHQQTSFSLRGPPELLA